MKKIRKLACGLANVAAALTMLGLNSEVLAATPLLSFGFNEPSTEEVTDSVNGLTGTPTENAPRLIGDSPSGDGRDRAIHFESGQYITVQDPDTLMKLNPDDPSFTLEAWVKFQGQPAGRQVFFYNNGPGGAISFSINTDRSVFVTTLGILDAGSAAIIPDDGEWHHIAVVHENGLELRYYVDGALEDTRDYESGVIFTRTQAFFSIGAESNGGLQFTGSLDRLKVTSGILSEDEFDYPAVTDTTSIAPSIAAQPEDASVDEGAPATFAVSVDGSIPTTIQWYENDVAIEGANSAFYTIDVTSFSQSGSVFKCVATNAFGEASSEEATLTVVRDTVAPELVTAYSSGTFDSVTVKFSKELDPASAENTANYSVEGVTINSATLDPSDSMTVVLSTSTLEEGAEYTLVVNNVTDMAFIPNVIAVDSQAMFYGWTLLHGYLTVEYYEGISGTPVANLTSSPKFPDSPDNVALISSFDLTNGYGDNYGSRTTGFVIPEVDGRYDFFTRSDDASQLWVSTDMTPRDVFDPAGPNAEETGCCAGFFEPLEDAATTEELIDMTAGMMYHVTFLQKEGGGGDWGQVAWREWNDPTPAAELTPIPGEFLATYWDVNGTTLSITQQPTDEFGTMPADGVPFITHAFATDDGGFTVTNTTPAPPGPWVYDSGKWTAAGAEADCTGPYNSQLISPPYAIGESGTVSIGFSHRYSFEGGLWDGGQVRYSVNDGEWMALPALGFTSNGYADGNIIGSGILRGQPGFNDKSPGFDAGEFITSTAYLGTFNAGDLIRVQFLGAWDDCSAGDAPNWEISSFELSAHGNYPLVSFETEAEAILHAESLAVSYQWQRDEGAGFTDISGATGPSLQMWPVAGDFGDKFRVTATVPGKTITSDEVEISTEPPPTMTPTIDIAWEDGQLVISFTGKLLSADTVDGSYAEVTGEVSSPYTPTLDEAHRFFRSVVE